jgi:hypothetical protein
MKQNGIMYKIPESKYLLKNAEELFGEYYIDTSYNTPLVNGASDFEVEFK